MKFKWPLREKKINIKKEHAKRYLLKYIKELKMHFDVTDNEIKDVIREVYYLKTPLYRVIRQMKKYLRKNNGN